MAVRRDLKNKKHQFKQQKKRSIVSNKLEASIMNALFFSLLFFLSSKLLFNFRVIKKYFLSKCEINVNSKPNSNRCYFKKEKKTGL